MAPLTLISFLAAALAAFVRARADEGVPGAADPAGGHPRERAYRCRVTVSEETSDAAALPARGGHDARSYLVVTRPGRCRATAETWGISYSTGWTRCAGGSGRALRFSGTAGGRRILWPLELEAWILPRPDGTATGRVEAYQADGGVTVTDLLECVPAAKAPRAGTRFPYR